MKIEKFTLGKWNIADQREVAGCNYDYSIIDADGWNIAHIENCHLDEEEANAHLLRSAPEMYWMLLELQKDFQALTMNPNVSEQVKSAAWMNAIKIEAMLKKARGES